MNETNVLLKTLYSHAKLQDPKNAVEIKSFQNQLEKCRLEELQTLNKLVTEICSSLESLKLDVFHRANREFNIENLRTKMFELKDKILALKFSIKEE